LLRQHNVPGAALAILDADEIVAAYSYGFARGTSLVSEATRFQAASISKTVNALLILTLVRDGAAGLDDPVNKHLKSFILSGPDADQVTVRMLLSHTGGTSVFGFDGYVPGQPLPSLRQILAGEAPANNGAVKVVRALGSYAYSGGGIMVLQQLVMDVTGQSYRDPAALRVLTPLSMAASSFEQPPSETGTGNLAHGHGPDGQPTPGGYNIYPELAAAGLWTTPSDVCRMLHGIRLSIFDGAGAILPQPIARQMVKPVDQGAGLGVFINNVGVIRHPGVNRGFRAVYELSLNSGKGVAVIPTATTARLSIRSLSSAQLPTSSGLHVRDWSDTANPLCRMARLSFVTKQTCEMAADGEMMRRAG
jgi:CubicO group peptidase (beta-lactamase class C family)